MSGQYGRRDETCPVGTGGGTRRVRSVRGGEGAAAGDQWWGRGRDASLCGVSRHLPGGTRPRRLRLRLRLRPRPRAASEVRSVSRLGHLGRVRPPPLLRTNRTRRVLYPVLIGHAVSLGRVGRARRGEGSAGAQGRWARASCAVGAVSSLAGARAGGTGRAPLAPLEPFPATARAGSARGRGAGAGGGGLPPGHVSLEVVGAAAAARAQKGATAGGAIRRKSGGEGGGGDRLQAGAGAPQPWVPRLRRSSSRRASTKP